jgi:chemotaxis protein methyltransferase CheR
LIADILTLVRVRCGIDFSAYREATVDRRIRNRMISVGAETLEEYRRVLEGSEAEAQQLIERITIKVSRFYRNPAAFDVLRRVVLPELGRRERRLRIWSAGCARGEEAYTLAMLLEEAGQDGIVCASDIDAQALESAAEGVYPAEALLDLPLPWRERFLEPAGCGGRARFRVQKGVRDRVRFSRHDLTRGQQPGQAPFDLICCRNLLIYWEQTMQKAILLSLVQALHEKGFLFLGEAEWPHGPGALHLREVPGAQRLFRAARNRKGDEA